MYVEVFRFGGCPPYHHLTLSLNGYPLLALTRNSNGSQQAANKIRLVALALLCSARQVPTLSDKSTNVLVSILQLTLLQQIYAMKHQLLQLRTRSVS